MYFWNTYPFVRFSIALILGIVLFENLPFLWDQPYTWSGILLGIYLILLLISHRTSFFKLRMLNGLFALLIITFLGGFLTKSKYHAHNENHYKNIDSYIRGFSGIITSPVNERTNHFRYDLELRTIIGDSTLSTSGKIHLYIRKDSLTVAAPLKYGDHVLVKGSFYSVPGPDNPEEFNYKKYLERQNIYSHSFVEHTDVKVFQNTPPNRLLSFAYSIREETTQIINDNIPEKRENAISKALLLGIKDFLDNDIKQAYASAGAMHVLAVSGLHVGIIYLILQFLLGRLRNQGNFGKLLFGLLSVLLIWFYAIVTGLSPSVLRAATMFSLVAASQAYSRDSNIYNTLGIAAFVLLVYDPYFIYSVGFQLSFAAVIGIVYLQPKLYRLLDINFLLLDKAWAITCVSIAAQLATFPLSAYYFHQFPTYFLISNLIVIPGAFLLLVIGVSMLLVDYLIPILGYYLGRILYHLMWAMNEIILKVENLPSSLIEWIYLDRTGLFLTYAIIFTFVGGLHFRSFKTLILCSALGAIFLTLGVESHLEQSKEKQLIFYEIKDKTAIDYVEGHQAVLYIDNYSENDLELLSFQIDPYRLSAHLPPIEKSIQNMKYDSKSNHVFQYGTIGNQKILLFDSTTFHLEFSDTIHTDILLINNGAVKSLKWLKQHFNFRYLIIGNKNSRYYSSKMKRQADEMGLQIHSLKEDGAFKLPLRHKKRADSLPALFTTNPD